MIWGIVSLTFVILKLSQVELFDQVAWWTIFVLPVLNTILTGVFDYLMMNYTNPNHVESLIRLRFMVLFSCKLLIAIYVFNLWLFARDDGFIDRYEDEEDWEKGFCLCQVYTVLAACILALIVTELIITTNIVKCLHKSVVFFFCEIVSLCFCGLFWVLAFLLLRK